MKLFNTQSARTGVPMLALVLAAMAIPVGSVAATDQEEQFQTHRGMGIEVSARFDNRAGVLAGTADRLLFSLALDTHSTNLFAIDIEASTEVFLDGERLVLSAVQWEGDTENSHHRYGLLTIRSPALPPDGKPGETLELRLRNAGRSDRSFEWTLYR